MQNAGRVKKKVRVRPPTWARNSEKNTPVIIKNIKHKEWGDLEWSKSKTYYMSSHSLFVNVHLSVAVIAKIVLVHYIFKQR